MKFSILSAVASLTLAFPSAHVQAAEEGDWIVRVGVHDVDPKSGNSDIVNVDSDTQLTFDVTYMLSSHLGLEVLAALPFEHAIRLTDGTLVGSTEHLPPTVSIQYRFGERRLQPYVGAGINYTAFFSEKTQGPLAGTELKLDNSTGLALQVGFDYEINERLIFNAVLRSIDIESDASLNGAPLTKVAIDPLALGLSIGWVF